MIKFITAGIFMADMFLITPERQAVLDKDAVYQFVERVNANAVKRPEWSVDYRAAHYEAFVEEAQKHALEVLKQHEH